MGPEQHPARVAPMAMLHIGANDTTIIFDRAPEMVVFDVGARGVADRHFARSSPTPIALENAIAAIEDSLMRVGNALPVGMELFTHDAAIQEIARVAGLPSVSVLSIDAVERVFQRLAAVSLGRPATMEGIPPSPEFAATVLILRELLHHLKYSAIVVAD